MRLVQDRARSFANLARSAGYARGDGLTAKLPSDHRRIGELLDELDRTIDDSTCAATIEVVEGRMAELPQLLFSHGDVERTLFLEADRILPKAEARTLLDSMQKWMLHEV